MSEIVDFQHCKECGRNVSTVDENTTCGGCVRLAIVNRARIYLPSHVVDAINDGRCSMEPTAAWNDAVTDAAQRLTFPHMEATRTQHLPQ